MPLRTDARDHGREQSESWTSCLNIPAKREYGTWDDLHAFKDGATLSDAVVAVPETHYGHAGRAFLEKLTRDKKFIVGGADGQVNRAASRFGLVAMAGELARSQDLQSGKGRLLSWYPQDCQTKTWGGSSILPQEPSKFTCTTFFSKLAINNRTALTALAVSDQYISRLDR